MEKKVCNINIGILGHVDSGKTSLVKSLSTLLSTAALDKNPQSQQRGITLDLGFSAFTLPLPDHLIQENSAYGYDLLQFTLVDCPGHASLIRTIIGGAQIIDMMLLVIDANKGIQTQTAECIVIGEITTDNLIIVLNKIDLIPIEERREKLDKVKRRLRKVFSTTKFPDVQIVETSAAVGGEKVASISSLSLNSNEPNSENIEDSQVAIGRYATAPSFGVEDLVRTIQGLVRLPQRNETGPFYYAIDHCFAIKGQGTVLTGTVLSGSVSINQTIEIPHLQLEKKVKSLQMFRKPVQQARQGDRVAIRLSSLDPTLIERGIAASPGSVQRASNLLCLIKKVRFFKQACKSGGMVHVTVGHSTVLAKVTFFGARELSEKTKSDTKSDTLNSFKLKDEKKDFLQSSFQSNFPNLNFSLSDDFLFQPEMLGSNDLKYGNEPVQWALIELQQPLFCPPHSLVIASRLDIDTGEHEKDFKDIKEDREGEKSRVHQCRLAFFGPIQQFVSEEEVSLLKLFVQKNKEGKVNKLSSVRRGLCSECICEGLFSDTGGVLAFSGLQVLASSGRIGTISGPFGSDGKCKIKFSKPTRINKDDKLFLSYKKYIHDKNKKIYQDFVEDTLPDEIEDSEEKELEKEILEKENRKKKGKKDLTVSKEIESKDETKENLNCKVEKKINTEINEKKIEETKETDEIKIAIVAPVLKEKEVVIDDAKADAIADENKLSVERRMGVVESVKEDPELLCSVGIIKGFFSMEENIKLHCGICVFLCSDNNEVVGELIGPFAKMGKCKVKFNKGVVVTPNLQLRIDIPNK